MFVSVHKKTHGFSLFELIFATVIMTILISLSIPLFNELKQRNRLTSLAYTLLSSINQARTHAISHQTRVLLCPLSQKPSCGDDWSDGHIIFEDNDFNNDYSSADRLISEISTRDKQISIRWRAFRAQTFIRFQPSGITWHQNGTFTLCHNDNHKLGRGISITKSGRAQLSRDLNGDGKEVFKNNRAVDC